MLAHSLLLLIYPKFMLLRQKK